MKKLLIPLLFILILLFSSRSVEARSGCCSHHGGVCGCGCCDGTGLSATCRPYYADVCGDNIESNSIQNVVIEPTSIPTAKPTLKPLVTKVPRPTLTPRPTVTTKPSPAVELIATPTETKPTKIALPKTEQRVPNRISFWRKFFSFFLKN